MQKKLALMIELAFSLADQVILSACTFLTMVLISKNCTKAEVGIFALAMTIVNISRTVQERAIASPYVAFLYRPGFDRASFKGSSFVHQGVLAAILTIATLFCSLGAYAANYPVWAMLLATFAFMLPFVLLRDQIRSVSAANFKVREQLLFDAVIATSQIVGMLLLIWIGQFTIHSVNIALGLGCIVPILVWFVQYGKTIQVNRKDVLSDWTHNWSYSRWLVGARVFGIFGYFFLPWLVWYFTGDEEVAALSVCTSLIGMSVMVITGLNSLFQPRTIRELQRTGLRGMWFSIWESMFVMTGILTLLSILFFFFGGRILEVVFGKVYAGDGMLVFVLSLNTLTISLASVFGNGLAALGRSKQFFWGEFSSFAVCIVIGLALVPKFGNYGAAIALLLGGVIASLITYLTLCNYSERFRTESEEQRVESTRVPTNVELPLEVSEAAQ